MKTSHKETTILCLLLVVLFVYGFYTLLLAPKLAENRELESQITADDAVVRGMYETIAGYQERRQTLSERVEQIRTLSERFYVRSAQEEYLELLDTLVKDSGLTFSRLSALEHTPLKTETEGYRCADPFALYADTAPADGQSADAGASSPTVETMGISLEVTGPYSGVRELLKRLGAYEKYILCGGLTVELPTEEAPEAETRAMLTLSFPRLGGLSGLRAESELPAETFDYTPPQEFLSGSYRNLYSPEKWLDAVQELFSR